MVRYFPQGTSVRPRPLTPHIIPTTCQGTSDLHTSEPQPQDVVAGSRSLLQPPYAGSAHHGNNGMRTTLRKTRKLVRLVARCFSARRLAYAYRMQAAFLAVTNVAMPPARRAKQVEGRESSPDSPRQPDRNVLVARFARAAASHPIELEAVHLPKRVMIMILWHRSVPIYWISQITPSVIHYTAP